MAGGGPKPKQISLSRQPPRPRPAPPTALRLNFTPQHRAEEAQDEERIRNNSPVSLLHSSLLPGSGGRAVIVSCGSNSGSQIRGALRIISRAECAEDNDAELIVCLGRQGPGLELERGRAKSVSLKTNTRL